MKSKLLGTYPLGTTSIRVFATDDCNGSFSRTKDIAEMTIGIDCTDWGDVVGILLHEAIEFSFSVMQCRFRGDIDMAQNSDGYTFHADHPQFSEIIAQAGIFVSRVLPDLATTYRKRRVK